MSTKDIYNYLKVNDQLITGGQPTEEQLKAVAAEGFATVINLATSDSRTALQDEAGVVQALGLKYHHIPVDWAAPKDLDFEAFEAAMQSSAGDKTLIHCAANFRVTAFYSLYALKHLRWTAAQAAEFRSTIWQGSDYPVWVSFIERLTAQIQGA
jgi:protein tyrosine phosphatase (PTP) superfamily phosphohydrolase (DUF442 family)